MIIEGRNTGPDWDIDLEFGQRSEDSLAEILSMGKVEVKTERDIWVKTGKIAIEVQRRDWRDDWVPSGLTATKAEYWAHILTKGEEIKFVILMPVAVLRRRVTHLLKNNWATQVIGGENDNAALVLVPLGQIIGNK